MRSGWRRSTRLSSSASITPLLSRASRSSRAPLSLVVRWPLSSTRTEPLHEGVQVDRLSPMADGSLGSGSWRNTLNFQENTIRYLRFQACLMNKPGLWEASPGKVGNVDPNTLPISEGLKLKLEKWADMYDATLNYDDQVKSGFINPEDEARFKMEGEAIGKKLKDELGSGYTIIVKV